MRIKPSTWAKNAVKNGLISISDLAFPPVCRLCNEAVQNDPDFCRRCLTELSASEKLMRTACKSCGLPSYAAAENVASASEPNGAPERPLCQRCPRKGFLFDSVTPVWMYLDRVRDAIVAAKFAHHAPLTDALGRQLGARVAESLASDPPETVTFVPSPLSRRMTRGGTGTEFLAASVARTLTIGVVQLLRLTRKTQKQAWLSDRERLANVRDAFSVKRGYAFTKPPDFRNRHILLVDDVLTTGATANEVSRVLLAGGARKVSLAVVARAVRQH